MLELGDTRPWEIDPRVFAIFTTGSDAGGAPVGAAAPTGRAGRGRSLARVARIVTPLGLQGLAGAGWNVIIPFTLAERRGRSSLIEAQFGIDRNADGRIEEGEFAPANLHSHDGRARGETRRSHTTRHGARREFLTAPASGRSNSLAWNSTADLDQGSYSRLRVLHTPQGRVIEDPNHPGQPMTVPGRGEIVFRIRAVRGRRRAGEWMQTAPFEWTTIGAPSLTIDGVTPGEPTFVEWSIFAGGIAVFCLLITVAIKIFPMFAVWEMTEEYEATHSDRLASSPSEHDMSDESVSANVGPTADGDASEGGST